MHHGTCSLYPILPTDQQYMTQTKNSLWINSGEVIPIYYQKIILRTIAAGTVFNQTNFGHFIGALSFSSHLLYFFILYFAMANGYIKLNSTNKLIQQVTTSSTNKFYQSSKFNQLCCKYFVVNPTSSTKLIKSLFHC